MKKQRGTYSARLKGAQSNRLKAINHPANRAAALFASELREKGSTLQEISEELNKKGFRTPNGAGWIPGSVSRILNRI